MKMLRLIVLAVPLASFCVPASAKDAPLYKTRDCSALIAQMDMNACAGDNDDAADARLNEVYKQLMASRSDPVAKQSIRDAERSWIKYRDKHCEEATAEEEGGSIRPMMMSNCLQDETDKRIRSLQRMLVCTAGVSVCNPQ